MTQLPLTSFHTPPSQKGRYWKGGRFIFGAEDEAEDDDEGGEEEDDEEGDEEDEGDNDVTKRTRLYSLGVFSEAANLKVRYRRSRPFPR